VIKLSVVIITYNEEKNIGRCLDSVQGIADEIVVVDSFSIDKTEEICKSKGVRFFQHKFDGHIEQKNYAVTLSSFPYILSIDADEALDDTLKKSILEVKENWSYDGYEMNRLTNYCGTWIKHCGWYPDRKLRLFDKSKGKWGGTNPHDKYEMQGGSKLGHLKGDMLHYSYYTIDDHYRQIQYFTDISSKELFRKGKRASFFKIYFSPMVKFVSDYILHLGFLDGGAGWTVCTMSAWATYTKYNKLRELYSAE
jgi:glycosyltransferase involved in cell wall biosynthesis